MVILTLCATVKPAFVIARSLIPVPLVTPPVSLPQAHTMSHTGQRPYVCEWEDCGRGFTSFYSLSAHCRTHTGQRPYACSAVGCQKAFKSSSDLRRHSRVHTGVWMLVGSEGSGK